MKEISSLYLVDNKENTYKEETKAEIFREIWEKIFIIQEENRHFDNGNDLMVNNSLIIRGN